MLFTGALHVKQSGAVEACFANNPEVRGSKPRSANNFMLFLSYVYTNEEVQGEFFFILSGLFFFLLFFFICTSVRDVYG